MAKIKKTTAEEWARQQRNIDRLRAIAERRLAEEQARAVKPGGAQGTA